MAGRKFEASGVEKERWRNYITTWARLTYIFKRGNK